MNTLKKNILAVMLGKHANFSDIHICCETFTVAVSINNNDKKNHIQESILYIWLLFFIHSHNNLLDLAAKK